MAESGGGAIVNVSLCWGGKAPGPNHALYCMTKAAIASLTQCMGMDHAHQGVRVNAVCPNEVNTPMLRSGFAKRGFDPDTAVALVTGGRSGIGQAIARRLQHEGATVYTAQRGTDEEFDGIRADFSDPTCPDADRTSQKCSTAPGNSMCW